MLKNDRFMVVYRQGGAFSGSVQILVDRETGVNYVFSQQGYAGGLTVLLDSYGKPVITRIPHACE